ncbi:33668_t:CDS:1, partial [Racocetra persica]
MDKIFAPEYFDIIFRFLPTNKDLHSCLLVNKHWATCAVPILWEAPFKSKDKHIKFFKVIKIYLAFIPDSTFLRLGYKRRIRLSIARPLLFNYPSFLKELSYDQFINSAIENKCNKDIIIELFKMFIMHEVRLRRLDVHSRLKYDTNDPKNLKSLVLTHFLCTSIFNKLTYFNCSYKWIEQNIQLFNAIAENCHNIENLKASIYSENEGIALAALIRSQKHLKKFSLIGSNFASFPVKVLLDPEHSLKSVTFKAIVFSYTTCQLNSRAINVLAQCTKIDKLKFKSCDVLNSYVLDTAFSNLTSFEYSYDAFNIIKNMPLIKLLSDLIMKSCNTLKRIKLDWYTNFHFNLINFVEINKFHHDITQLVEIITHNVINLEYLTIPLYSLEQLIQIHRTNTPLRRLEIYLDRKINLYSALSLFANSPLKSPKYSIQLSFDCIEVFTIQLLDQFFESIFYKSNRIVDVVLHLSKNSCFSIERKELLLKNYPRLKITAA